MPHMWVLFFVVTSGFLAPNNVNTIFGFTTLETCEFTRAQLVDKMKLTKSACIEIPSSAPPASPPDPDH